MQSTLRLATKVGALLCAVGLGQAACALTVTGNSIATYAAEVLVSNPLITLNAVGINSTSQGVVAGNGFSITMTLSSGTFASCGTFRQINDSNMEVNAGWTVAGVGSATCTYSNVGANVVANSSAANTFFRLEGATAQGFNLYGGDSSDPACNFVPGQLTLTARYFNSQGTEVDVAQAGGNAPSGRLNEAIVARSQQAVVGVFTAGATTPSLSNLLDVQTGQRPSAGIAGSKFVYPGSVAGTWVNSTATTIGTVYFTDTVGLQAQSNGVTDYTGATLGGTATIYLTANQPIPAGVRFFFPTLWGEDTDCADLSGSLGIRGVTLANSMSNLPDSQTITGSSAVLTTNFSNGNFVSTGYRRRVCMQVPGNTVIPPLSFTGYAVIDRGPTVVKDYAGGPNCPINLAKIAYNGGVIEVRNYIPDSAGAFGWKSFLRIINGGSSATPITAYFVGDDGSTTTPAVLVDSLPARGNVTLTSATIETKIGRPFERSSNPRLVISGGTEALRVQMYGQQPNGFWTEMSSGQDDGTLQAGSSR